MSQHSTMAVDGAKIATKRLDTEVIAKAVRVALLMVEGKLPYPGNVGLFAAE